MNIKLKSLNKEFSICKVTKIDCIDMGAEYCFIGKTDEEISVVCETAHIPVNTVECDRGWLGFKIQGVLDFSLIGILSKISGILAENEIGIFVVSTFNTDYVFVKSEKYSSAVEALKQNGYEFE